jgi:hypothetical protein
MLLLQKAFSHGKTHWFHSNPTALISFHLIFSVHELKIIAKEQQFVSLEEMQEKIQEQLTLVSSELCVGCWEKTEMSF